jgi:hypothetical protein
VRFQVGVNQVADLGRAPWMHSHVPGAEDALPTRVLEDPFGRLGAPRQSGPMVFRRPLAHSATGPEVASQVILDGVDLRADPLAKKEPLTPRAL